MPTYQYQCKDCGEALEVVQKFTDDALTVCPNCQGELRKVFSAVGIVFKGSGFYRTDSRSASSSSTPPASSNGSGSSGHAHRYVDQFFGQRIEGAGSHDLLNVFPCTLERSGIVGDGFPEVIDPISFSRSHDVVVNGPDFGARILVFNKAESGHEISYKDVVHHRDTEAQRK